MSSAGLAVGLGVGISVFVAVAAALLIFFVAPAGVGFGTFERFYGSSTDSTAPDSTAPDSTAPDSTAPDGCAVTGDVMRCETTADRSIPGAVMRWLERSDINDAIAACSAENTCIGIVRFTGLTGVPPVVRQQATPGGPVPAAAAPIDGYTSSGATPHFGMTALSGPVRVAVNGSTLVYYTAAA